MCKVVDGSLVGRWWAVSGSLELSALASRSPPRLLFDAQKVAFRSGGLFERTASGGRGAPR